ncbi:MAG: thioredoxin family protein [Nocardioides sp.]
MTIGAWVLLLAVVVALGFGLYRAYADGRFRGTHPLRAAVPSKVSDEGARRPSQEPLTVGGSLPGEVELGERATLLQFSSAFCAPCRSARHTLAGVARAVPGVVHVELDAEHHLDLVRRLGILRTPTTLVLDANGQEVRRASGAPRKEQVLAALEAVRP